MYSIVDIETTGGHASGNRIIEIAIFRFNGKRITGRYHSLINPEVRIPGFISSLTGITDEMVCCAPTFRQVADDIFDFMKDTIFVAHNVNFDYTFVKKEFAALGKKIEMNKLCTVRASRKIFPGLPSYSLGNLCGQLRIRIKDRHRAEGDAKATVTLLKMLLQKDQENFIGKSLKRNSRETLIPANLPREQFDTLPEETGVYYFHDHKGKVIYVGKAVNIRKRVISHFSAKQQSRQSQNFMKDVHGVSFELCGNELIALLLESQQIKKHWPPFNRSQKRTSGNIGIYHYEDREGYLRVSIGNVIKHQKPLLCFRYIGDAREFLIDKSNDFNLCPKLLSLQNAPGPCLDYHLGNCKGACNKEEQPETYNIRVEEAISSFTESGKSYIIQGRGRTPGEYSVVAVERGKYLGYGFVPADAAICSLEECKEYVNGNWDNQDVQKILESYLRIEKNAAYVREI